MAYQITKIDIAALRKADSVSFARDEKGAFIAMTKKAGDPTEANPFPQDVHYNVACDAHIADYTGSMWGRQHDCYRAAYHTTSAQWDEEWQTVASLLKPGDELTLAWAAGNDSPALREKGIMIDELRLNVSRDRKRLVFLLARQTSVDDRWRMVRRDEAKLALEAA